MKWSQFPIEKGSTTETQRSKALRKKEQNCNFLSWIQIYVQIIKDSSTSFGHKSHHTAPKLLIHKIL